MDLHTLITIILALSAWFILIRWVLPWIGVPTCMSGCCCAAPAPAAGQQADSSKDAATNPPNVQACCPENRDDPKPIHTDVSN